MKRLTNDEKAKIYNNMLNQYQRLQEEVRLIRAQEINVSEANQRKINFLETKMKRLYEETKKLYI